MLLVMNQLLTQKKFFSFYNLIFANMKIYQAVIFHTSLYLTFIKNLSFLI